LTGHLVLSTLHTNSAVGAITRLEDMGVEAFLLSSTLLGVISQRLVRKLCPECKSVTQLDVEQVNGFEIKGDDVIYQANGCPSCLQTGFRGRTGIYEMIEIDDTLSTMIHDGVGQSKIERYCRTRSRSLREDGIRKVVLGDTTLDEVLRVTRDGG
ncbi:MAG TPA: ATPase, T2SS/T4P/T4SS family, partial [Gammaproteobacteria bacterium]|nr:ATPase, T2SS/T4P/T4SS family [Gammaproteobacteria bacterium]